MPLRSARAAHLAHVEIFCFTFFICLVGVNDKEFCYFQLPQKTGYTEATENWLSVIFV